MFETGKPTRCVLGTALFCLACSEADGSNSSRRSVLPEPAAAILDTATAEPSVGPDGDLILHGSLSTPPPSGARTIGSWHFAGMPLRATVATDGSGLMRIALPATSREILVERVGLGGNRATGSARLEDRAVWLGASPGAEAVLFSVPRGLEELWVLREPNVQLAYRLTLPDGFTLEAGSQLGSAEIHDGHGATRLRIVADRAWDAEGAPLEARLRVAGNELRVDVQSSERFPVVVDPLWESIEGWSMVKARGRHTATLLADGRILLTGGLSDGQPTDTMETYDPLRRRFERIVDRDGEPVRLSEPRVGHSATLLRDGSVLIAGGNESGRAATAERFDPKQRAFLSLDASGSTTIALTEPMRANHTATLLRDDGRVLLAGGCAPSTDPAWTVCGTPIQTAEIYDPTHLTDTARQAFHRVEAPAAEDPSAAMMAPRAQHSATLLPTGKVILVGGTGWYGYAEEFDPITELFSPALEIGPGRNSHTATLLHDTTILLAGNWVFLGATPKSAEMYDPNGSVTTLGQLQSMRSWHSATLLPDGRVLLAGGISDEGTTDYYPPLEQSELYDQGAFLPSDSLKRARAFHTSTLLPDSTVLVSGGHRIGGGEENSAEIFAVEPGEWRTLGSAIQRSLHTATLMPNGRVLLAGGVGVFTSVLEELDPVTGESHPISVGGSSRQGHTATLLRDGTVLLAGGAVDGGGVTGALGIYDPEGAELVEIDEGESRTGHTATLLPDGSVLLAGGTTVKAAAEIYQPTERLLVETDALAARAHHTATLLADGRVLIAGGEDGGLEPTDTLWLYTRGSASGSARFDLAPAHMNQPRAQHTATMLPSGQVLIVGGISKDGKLATAEVFDPNREPGESPIRVTAGGLRTARAGHTATLLLDGRVLITGGLTEGGGAAAEAEIYDPASDEFASVGPDSSPMNPRASHSATLVPSGGVLVVGGPSAAPAELWRDDWSHDNERRPVLDLIGGAAPSSMLTFVPGVTNAVVGQRFTCMSEASGGRSSTTSTNHPVAFWMPIDGGFPTVGGVSEWTTSTGNYTPPPTSFPGPGQLFFVTNGIRSAGLVSTMARAAVGIECTSDSQCDSGFCVDGRCCTSACDGPCVSCRTGTCEPESEGTEDPQCEAQSPLTCGTTGLCSNDGACAQYEDGTPCSEGAQAAQCLAGTCTSGPCSSTRDCASPFVCNAEGQCIRPPQADSGGGCSVVRKRPALVRSGARDESMTWLFAAALSAVLGFRRRARA